MLPDEKVLVEPSARWQDRLADLRARLHELSPRTEAYAELVLEIRNLRGCTSPSVFDRQQPSSSEV